MYKPQRKARRPPKMVRLPRKVPLSRLKGASPAIAAACVRLSVPSSGIRASRSTEHTRIDLIGFGQNASRTSILPHPIGLHQTDFDPVLLGRIEQSPLVASAGFADQMHRKRTLLGPFGKCAQSAFIVSEATRAL